MWPDEERLLATIRYLHADLDDAARHVLERILPAAAQRVAFDQAIALAQHLADAGYCLGFGGPLMPDEVTQAGGLSPTLH